MKEKHIIALDQGTTSSRSVLFNSRAEIIGITQKEFTQHFPQPGWVEHDPVEILDCQRQVLMQVVKENNLDPANIAAIGITNQRETTIVWDKNSGEPIFNAIVWQDRRTAEICEKMKEDGLEDYVKQSTGLVIDAYFSGTKIKWILDNVPGARQKAEKGELLTLRRRANDLQSIPKPLNGCTGNEDTAFQSILDFPINSPRNGCQQSGFAGMRFFTGIHQHKASGAIGVFCHPRLKTGLAEQGRLLVACNSRYGDGHARKFHFAKIAGRAPNLRQHIFWQPQRSQ